MFGFFKKEGKINKNTKKLEFLGEFDIVWMIPYIFKEVLSNNPLQLKTLDGLAFPICINGSQYREYKV
jgi:hypothetical protein